MQPVPTSSYDVLIIGGGFAGVTAARNLTRRGHDVVLLEARSRLGGRTWTTDYAGLRMDLGGKWIHWSQPHVFAEMTRYGLGLVESPSATRCRWRTSDAAGMDEFEAIWAEIRDAGESFSADSRDVLPRPYEPWMSPVTTEVDQLSVQDRLDELDLASRQRSLVTTHYSLLCSGSCSAAGAMAMLRWHALAGWDFDLMAEATFRYRIRDGTGALLDAICDDGRAAIELETPVDGIEVDNRRVAAHCRDGRTFTARAGVIAVPLNVLSEIDFSPALDEGKRAAAAVGQPSRGFNSWVRIEGDWTGVGAYGLADDPVAVLNAEYTTDLGTIFFAGGSDAAAVDVSSLEEVEGAIQRLMPEARVVDVAGHDWLRDEFSKGTWCVLRPGQLTESLPALQRPERRLAFAGSDTASGWNGFIDGAIETGHRASRDVGRILALDG